MDARRVQTWIAVVAGLALTGLLLVGGSALADSPPGTVTSHQVRAAGWSSPWVSILPGNSQVFHHNLGGNPDDYAVELMAWDDIIGFNRANYGGLEDNGTWHGVHWQGLTSNTIEVHRQDDDTDADRVRVRVWQVPSPPDYDSGWTNINQGVTLPFTHDVGVNPMDLTVSLSFSGTDRGIHQYGYGGLDVDGLHHSLGALWRNLTTDTLEVTRGPNDTDAKQVRVVVVDGDPPHYDSGWQNIARGGSIALSHDLMWNPMMLLVRGECYDTGARGINQMYSGGNHNAQGYQGAHFESLTGISVTVVRRTDDQYCPQARVRIWKRAGHVYLPTALRAS